jgi:hypothetical protein
MCAAIGEARIESDIRALCRKTAAAPNETLVRDQVLAFCGP